MPIKSLKYKNKRSEAEAAQVSSSFPRSTDHQASASAAIASRLKDTRNVAGAADDHVLQSGSIEPGSYSLDSMKGCFRRRREAATALCHSIADCDPADACEIMAAALDDLRAGTPIAPFLSIMDEAASWADFATRQELKAYTLACYTRMAAADQVAFLGYVGGPQ